MVDELRIIYRGYGIADAFPDGTVELNKHLKDYPKLQRALLQHEAKHTREKGFTKKDFVHDLTTIDQINQWQMIKFMSRHPLSLIQVLPITYSKRRGIMYDINSLIVWGALIGVISLALIIGNVV